MSIRRRAGGLIGSTALATVLLAAPAAAHVSVQPAEAPKGGFVKLAFRVPNESETAGTVKVEVRFPLDTPLAAVRIKPLPGWTADVATVQLPAPVRTDDGEVTEAVHSIVWTAQPGIRIGPGEFAEFEVSGGPLPEGTDRLVLPTAQTYDDGRVVSWIDQPPAAGAAEPEHPAPVLRLVDGASSATGEAGEESGVAAPGTAGPAASATGVNDNAARWLGGAGLVLGALAVGLAGGTMLANRRPANQRPANQRPANQRPANQRPASGDGTDGGTGPGS